VNHQRQVSIREPRNPLKNGITQTSGIQTRLKYKKYKVLFEFPEEMVSSNE
jgi:hypothetical protein